MATLAFGTNNQSVAKTWSKILHGQTLDSSYWKKAIGKDKAGEGELDNVMAGYPIVSKSELGKAAGDRITVSLKRQLYTGDTLNAGRTGNENMVGNETVNTFLNTKVLVAHWREATAVEKRTTTGVRTPFDLKSEAVASLKTIAAKQLDDGVFTTIYGGFSPNVYRELGLTTAPLLNGNTRVGAGTVAAGMGHPNVIFGKAPQATYLALANTDICDTSGLDILRTYINLNNIQPCVWDGRETWMLCLSPLAVKQLRADSLYQSATNIAYTGKPGENPLLSYGEKMWAGLIIGESNKITSAKNWSGAAHGGQAAPAIAVTGAGDTAKNTLVVTASPATTSGLAASTIQMNVLMGANAIARGFAKFADTESETYMEELMETDYGRKQGFSQGYVYGDRRCDYFVNADTGTDGNVVNQSSALWLTYSPGISNLPTIWS